MTWPDNLEALTAADVMHRRLTSLPAQTTVGELREYFAASASRKLALLADGGQYAGAVEASALPEAAEAGQPAVGYAADHPTVRPDADATATRDLGLELPSLRVPVVSESGELVGIVAITRGRDGFCGQGPDA
jgi:CBS-domain-containing membrane protein